MDLGTFSVSLAVKDMAASRGFYQKLGFEMVTGDGETWTILANGSTIIGLFQGMFDANIMTFNPGGVGMGEDAPKFTDVREVRSRLASDGIEISADTTGETPSGPASFTVTDPDGNAILFDQHV